MFLPARSCGPSRAIGSAYRANCETQLFVQLWAYHVGQRERRRERKNSEHLIALFSVVGSDEYVNESTHLYVCVCERVHTP